MPKISVIVPIYGVEKYIERCAKSLFGQTLDDIEFIFVDDCTPDNSIKILEGVINEHRLSFIERSWTVKVERMPTNSGLAAVRKYGLQIATGDYIVHCDSDDWVVPTAYEQMYNYALGNNADLVLCDYYIAQDSDSDREYKYFRKNIISTNRDELVKRCFTSSALNTVWSAMAHRTLYEKLLPPRGAQAEDKTFMLQLLYYSNKTVYLDKPLYYYRLASNSISRSVDLGSIKKRYQQIKVNREVIMEFVENENIKNKYKKEIQYCLFRTRSILEDYLEDEECRNLWVNSFPESTNKIILNPYLSVKEKLKYYLRCLYIKMKK